MVFIFIFLAVILFIILVYFSKIRIQINNLKFQSTSKRHINRDYEIIIKLCVLNIIPILKINITKTKLERLRIKEKVEQLDLKAMRNKKDFDKKALEAIKELNLCIKNIDLYIDLGTENACLTSIIVPALSTVISIILSRKVKKFKNQVFIINPIFINQNLINIHLSGIFEIKIGNIINTMYILSKERKKGVRENERTSNRRAYGYSYE